MKKEIHKLTIPFKKIKDDVIIPKPSKKGDAGADAHIVGFKKIINEEGKKELVEIKAETEGDGPTS